MGNKVAFITGASRGIGKAIAIKLAKEGYNVVIAARSLKDRKILPGNIYATADEINKLNKGKALPIPCDVTNILEIEAAKDETLKNFGRIDVIVNNAGAIWPVKIDDMPMEKFDLVMDTNVRASFAVIKAFLPTLRAQKSGHIIMLSPKINLDKIAGKTGYMISKFGMTMLTLGLSEELKDDNIYVSSLWPKTMIETAATINFKMGDPTMFRTPEILSDALFEMLQHKDKTQGKIIIDEEFLRDLGYTDFDKYLSVKGGKPVDLPF